MRIELDFLSVLAQWPLLVKGVAWTVGLTVIASLIGVALGVVFAWTRSHGPSWAKWVVGTYVELIRNTPFIVQLFFVFFGLPAAGRPKNTKNSCTMNGVLRMSSTYVPTTHFAQAGPCERVHANTTPSATPMRLAITVSPTVHATPLSSNGHCDSTDRKSSSIRISMSFQL